MPKFHRPARGDQAVGRLLLSIPYTHLAANFNHHHPASITSLLKLIKNGRVSSLLSAAEQGSPYQLPDESRLPMVHAQHEVEMFEALKQQRQLTLSLDGWSNNFGNSIEVFVALKGAKKKYFLDVLDLNRMRHTADNIFSAIKDSLRSKNLGFDQTDAVVTDYLLLWSSFGHPSMEEVVKGNKTLVNYFSAAGFWREHLSSWQKANKVKHALQTLCETRWYSMAKVCLGVQHHEAGFQKCLELFQDPLVDTPALTASVISVIED
ncbi:hypothetical protein VP01_12g4 [Puccinia sorghi]|uniref:DUF659 domain-containing protein n=1 Tax=Puccinia sorghi TaxID=27349 RepID=A0A0L6VN68_9BASI|nr:hypothetical protein VP01_12g4 [Puccinia sorghi]